MTRPLRGCRAVMEVPQVAVMCSTQISAAPLTPSGLLPGQGLWDNLTGCAFLCRIEDLHLPLRVHFCPAFCGNLCPRPQPFPRQL